MEYAIWRACERFGIRPPGVREHYDDMSVSAKAMLISYDQIRQIEDNKRDATLAQMGVRF